MLIIISKQTQLNGLDHLKVFHKQPWIYMSTPILQNNHNAKTVPTEFKYSSVTGSLQV